MAILKIIDENRKLTDRGLIRDYLMACGIRYEYWKPEHAVEANAPAEEILQAYAKEIEKLKASGGYVTADVIAVNAQTPGLHSVHGILLDIEGTTTPIQFVYHVLFPFARAHLKDYLRDNADSEELRRDLLMLREEHRDDMANGLAPPKWVDEPLDAQIESVAH